MRELFSRGPGHCGTIGDDGIDDANAFVTTPAPLSATMVAVIVLAATVGLPVAPDEVPANQIEHDQTGCAPDILVGCHGANTGWLRST